MKTEEPQHLPDGVTARKPVRRKVMASEAPNWAITTDAAGMFAPPSGHVWRRSAYRKGRRLS